MLYTFKWAIRWCCRGWCSQSTTALGVRPYTGNRAFHVTGTSEALSTGMYVCEPCCPAVPLRCPCGHAVHLFRDVCSSPCSLWTPHPRHVILASSLGRTFQILRTALGGSDMCIVVSLRYRPRVSSSVPVPLDNWAHAIPSATAGRFVHGCSETHVHSQRKQFLPL